MRVARIRSPIRSVPIGIVALACLLGSDPAAAQATGSPPTPPAPGASIADATRAEIARHGRARVIVVLETDREGGAGGAAGRGPGVRDRRPDRAERARRIAAARARVLSRVPEGRITVHRQFEHVAGLVVTVDEAGLADLAASADVRRLEADGGGGGHLNQALPLTGIDAVKALGPTGLGVTVAILDSGYDSDHADLADDLIAEACFCSDMGAPGGCCPDGSTQQVGPGSAEDDHGHGTHVSGIVTGAGQVAPEGAAPDATIVAVKVLDAQNRFSTFADVIAGLDWIIANRPDVDVVNMSLGTDILYPGPCDGPGGTSSLMVDAVNTLTAMGVTVFASSGNDGSGTAMASPACIANAISVGAVWDSDQGSVQVNNCLETGTAADQVTCFSNGDATTDLLAPGAPTTSTAIGGGATTFFGTSQASPLAAACAALLLEDDPTLSPADLEARLEASPTRVVDAKNGLDTPRVDCHHALLVPEPASSLGALAGLSTVAALASISRRRRGASPAAR